MLCFLAFLRLLYVDWDDLDDVLLLLGLDVVLVLGDGLSVTDSASLRVEPDRRRCLERYGFLR